jgi:hypothetical protein
MKRLFVIILLSGLFWLAGGFAIVEAQTHGTALMAPAIMKSTNNDTVMTIADLTVDSLRLVVGLEEMRPHIARMVKLVSIKLNLCKKSKKLAG